MRPLMPLSSRTIQAVAEVVYPIKQQPCTKDRPHSNGLFASRPWPKGRLSKGPLSRGYGNDVLQQPMRLAMAEHPDLEMQRLPSGSSQWVRLEVQPKTSRNQTIIHVLILGNRASDLKTLSPAFKKLAWFWPCQVISGIFIKACLLLLGGDQEDWKVAPKNSFREYFSLLTKRSLTFAILPIKN